MSRRIRDTWSRSEPSWYKKDWKTQASGGDKALEGCSGWVQAGHSRHQFQRSGGQYQDMGNQQGKPCRLRWPRYGSCKKIFSSRTGSLSQTYKKNTEANTKVCDLSRKTMQALSNLTLVCARFEEAGADLEVETSERDLLHADIRTALEGVAEVQHEQEHLKAEQKNTRDSLDAAFYRTQQPSRSS